MKYNLISGQKISTSRNHLLASFCFSSGSKSQLQLTKSAQDLDILMNRILSRAVSDQKFKSDHGNIILVHNSNPSLSVRTAAIVGLGDIEKVTVGKWMDAVASLVRRAKDIKSESLSIAVPQEIMVKIGDSIAIARAIEAAGLALYEFNRYKSETQLHEISNIDIYPETDFSGDVSKLIDQAQYNIFAVNTARDLVNEPSSVTTPMFLADFALAIARDNPGIKCEILKPAEMQKLGMNALLGIAKGSDEKPRFIKLDYNRDAQKTICLVGKGITFDSGGLSLKPENSMETMKSDMAGAAVILGIFSVLSQIKPNVNVVGLMAACENMPSGKAIKPGDVVKAMNGKTIEIANTDAEGRVILADTMSYAAKFVKPDVIVDLATLTGACMVALGEDIAGLFANNQDLARDLKLAAGITGERIWEMPLAYEYQDLLKSDIADIRNVSKTKYGGAITGALFISEFIPKNIAWAHLDIAGPAYAEKSQPVQPVGGTGFGVRMMIEYLSQN